VVDYPNSKLNTSKTQISLPYKLTIDTATPNPIDDEVFWEEVGEEIAYLANLVTTHDTS
jgi:hypothetical protein